MSTLTDTVTISLGLGCSEECDAFAAPLYEQLAGGGYDECSVLPIPESIDAWRAEHRTARKRADRARRLGYEPRHVIRHEHADELFEINTSMPHRQGRPMAAGYLIRPSAIPEQPAPCWSHAVHPTGVFDADGTLRAYLWMYRSGDLALVSSILGHADDLANDVMYLLFQFALDAEISNGPGVCVYNRADSGTPGLHYFKSKLGFEARDVEWRL